MMVSIKIINKHTAVKQNAQQQTNFKKQSFHANLTRFYFYLKQSRIEQAKR